MARESLGYRAPGICSAGVVIRAGTEVAVMQEEGFILSDPEKQEAHHATQGHAMQGYPTRGHTKRLQAQSGGRGNEEVWAGKSFC